MGEGSHAAAATEFPAPVHSGESSGSDGHRHKRPVTGSGCAHLEAEHRLRVLELSNRSFRQDSATLSKQVAYWRREAKRSRVDLQLHEQDTIKHGKKSYFSRCEVALSLHCEGTTKGGIGAAALADLQQIDTSKPSIFSWEIRVGACLALSFRNFYKQNVSKLLDEADSTRTDIVNCDIHFMMGDASNARLFHNTKLQTLQIMSK